MYKGIKFVIYLLYKHYFGGGTKNIAYESALMTVTFFILIHLLQIKVLFWGGGLTFGSTKPERLLSVSFIFIPVYLILNFFFRKKDTLDPTNNYPINLKKGYLYLMLYCVLSLSLLVFLDCIS